MAAILPLNSPELDLASAGGKGLNLGRLARLGYPVPPGFVVLTPLYRLFVQTNQMDGRIASRLEALAGSENPAELESASFEIRAWFDSGTLPPEITAALLDAYAALGRPPVAVRSSATAEDLPDLSFAGQQDTFLNVIGEQSLLSAVVRCWSSLWTARAIAYRLRNTLAAQDDLALAVVVQEMVQSQAAGVMFTANPLTGLRSEVVIEAAFGLGEALVSGQVDPDQYLVSCLPPSGPPSPSSAPPPSSAASSILFHITSRKLGSKTLALHPAPQGGVQPQTLPTPSIQALPDEHIQTLAALGWQVAQDFASPQDIEWAFSAGNLYLLQSRPITSLYPLPSGALHLQSALHLDSSQPINAPHPASPLQVWGSFGAFQGMLDPMTPFGRDAISAIGATVANYLGWHISIKEQKAFVMAGERLFVNLTSLVRNRLGRKVLMGALSIVEAGLLQVIQPVLDDPRLAPGKQVMRPVTALRLARLVIPTLARMLRTLANPDAARQRAMAGAEQLFTEYQQKNQSVETLAQHMALIWDIYHRMPIFMIGRMVPCFAPGMAMLNMLNRLAGGVEDGARLVMEVTRGLPYNVTTQMDLALWETARQIQHDSASAAHFADHSAAQLADDYQLGLLPAVAQASVAAFLERYGVRGVGEIDIGRTRWREDPTAVMQSLLSYLHIKDEQRAPDAVFARGEEAARLAIDRLAEQVRRTPGGWLKARLVRWAAYRVRTLAGLREMPKFLIVRLMGFLRHNLLRFGRGLVEQGVLDEPQDIFFFHLFEIEEIAAWQSADGAWCLVGPFAGLSPQEARRRVIERKQRFALEKRRRQVPRLLLSDGRAFYEGVSQASTGAAGSICGSPVSPGLVEGRVQVVFDPHQTQLAPGDILVCPGTDPAWTPLFLAAGGLVMEVGGMMTHGSVVAREYGIPAVVGVSQATQRLHTGQRIRLDGSTGTITLLELE